MVSHESICLFTPGLCIAQEQVLHRTSCDKATVFMYRDPGYTGIALFPVSACSGVGQTGILEFTLWMDPQASMQNKLALIVVIF